jgi:alkyl hydroperoxide reductase subunit F
MHDSIIIGAGPAGLAAAIYLARQKLNFVLITKVVGGQTLWSSEVENYLGFHLIDGVHLVEKFKEHLNDYKDSFTLKDGESVTGVEQTGAGFRVVTDKGSYEAKTVLAATGEKHRELGVPGEKEFYGRGVTYCATCDAPLYRGKDVAIVGGGNSAMEAALFLEKYASSVTILTVNDALAGDSTLKSKISAGGMTVIPNAKAAKILGDSFVSGLEYELKDGKREVLKTQGVFIEIGLIPISDFIGIVKKNKRGEIEVNVKNETSVPGIWAAGDVTNVTEKQIAVAVGEGSKAALGIIKWLQKER